jgi:hypothetical protein
MTAELEQPEFDHDDPVTEDTTEWVEHEVQKTLMGLLELSEPSLNDVMKALPASLDHFSRDDLRRIVECHLRFLENDSLEPDGLPIPWRILAFLDGDVQRWVLTRRATQSHRESHMRLLESSAAASRREAVAAQKQAAFQTKITELFAAWTDEETAAGRGNDVSFGRFIRETGILHVGEDGQQYLRLPPEKKDPS